MPADLKPRSPEPGERTQFTLKFLLALMTGICVLVSAAIQFRSGTVVLIPLGLLSWLLVRDRWALTVVGLYGLILFAMAVPLAAAAFQQNPLDQFELYAAWPFWLWFDVMIISQAALLVVPVAAQRGRPQRRSQLLKPLLACGLMIGLLVLGGVASVWELLAGKGIPKYALESSLVAGLVTWGFWTLLFYLASRGRDANQMVTQQCRLLLAGSILELLIAVPTHIVARSRNYCCAGLMTFLGLTFGIAVMLFSFGPALFFLFSDRWQRLHQRTQGEEMAEGESGGEAGQSRADGSEERGPS